MKYNFQQIVDKMNEMGVSKSEFGYSDWEHDMKSVFGEVQEVYQHGGEGMGDTYTTVQYFKDHDIYIRIDGYYQSYDGTDFDYADYYEVKPEQETITVYNAVKEGK